MSESGSGPSAKGEAPSDGTASAGAASSTGSDVAATSAPSTDRGAGGNIAATSAPTTASGVGGSGAATSAPSTTSGVGGDAAATSAPDNVGGSAAAANAASAPGNVGGSGAETSALGTTSGVGGNAATNATGAPGNVGGSGAATSAASSASDVGGVVGAPSGSSTAGDLGGAPSAGVAPAATKGRGTRGRLGGLAVRAGFALFLDWLYLGDLVRLIRVQSAPVAMLNAPPPVVPTIAGALLALAVTGTLLLDAQQRLPPLWRPRSLIHFSAVALLFFDFTVLASRVSPVAPEVRIAMTVNALAEVAGAAATTEEVPADRRGFEDWARQAGEVPLFKQGERVAQWHVEVREKCAGPATTPGAAPAGTLIYCLSEDHRRAWISVVALPFGRRFGLEPAILSTEGGLTAEVRTVRPVERDEPPVWEPPTPD